MGQRSGRSPRSQPALAALGWFPVAAALGVFFQVAYLGLRPALAEEQRLIAAQAELEARHARAVALGEELEQLLRAQADPIYRERERRLLLTPAE